MIINGVYMRFRIVEKKILEVQYKLQNKVKKVYRIKEKDSFWFVVFGLIKV